MALPARRITINLAPADLPKEGSHYDLPIALGLMAAIGAIPHDALSGFTVLGELGLDGSIATMPGDPRTTLLERHFAAVEEKLLREARIPANAGHKIHRGTPREAFIREFLQGHISARATIGTGEIIGAQSKPRAQRNQFDIVLHESAFPKLSLGGGISTFLAETVIATIEVKSKLTEVELGKAVASAARAKQLPRNMAEVFRAGHVPSGILSYVVAYDGPAKIKTVFDWLIEIEKHQGLNQTQLPANGDERSNVVSQSLDGVFVLGRGSVVFDNGTSGLISDAERAELPNARFHYLNSTDLNVAWLFLQLTHAMSNTVAGPVRVLSQQTQQVRIWSLTCRRTPWGAR